MFSPRGSAGVATLTTSQSKKKVAHTISLGKQRVYTIGLERRVYTIEVSNLNERKEGFYGDGTYFLLFSNILKLLSKSLKLLSH